MRSTDSQSFSMSALLARRPATMPKLATTVTAGGTAPGASDGENSGIGQPYPPSCSGAGGRHGSCSCVTADDHRAPAGVDDDGADLIGRFRSGASGNGHGMHTISAPPVPISQVGRATHDIGLAGLLGGNLFGRLALHPSVTQINDKAERGKLVNSAWRRYGIINSLSLGAVVAGWLGARANEAAPGRLSPAERRLALAKDAL